MSIYRDEVLITAIECGQLAVLPLCVKGAAVVRPCAVHGGCTICSVGIADHSMKTCPFCGEPSRYPQYKEIHTTKYIGRIHRIYPCGTIINMCLRMYGEPYTITSVVIGGQCRGVRNDDVI